MVYNWKTSMPVKAQAAGEYLETLEREKGEITPRLVLEASRAEDALLHPCFEWDNNKAAEKYRESQAGHLIRNLVVTIEKPDVPAEPVRAFVNVSSERTGSFISIQTALSDSVSKEQMLRNAYKELQAFQKKYKNLAELAEVFSAIGSLGIAA